MTTDTFPDRRIPRSLADGILAFPQSARSVTDSALVWNDIVYAAEAGYRPLMLDLRVPLHANADQPVPVVVWIHGGAWHYGSRKRRAPNLHRHQIVEKIIAHGMAVVLIDYRLINEAKFPAQLADVRAAIRWVKANAHTYSLNSEKVVLFGESAGAHLALLHGLTQSSVASETLPRVGEFPELDSEVRAVVDWYSPATITDLAESGQSANNQNPEHRLVHNSDWSAQDLSPLHHVHANAPPIFISHGRDDEVISVDHSRALAEALRNVGATVEYFETEGGHVFEGSTEIVQVFIETITFIQGVVA